MFILTQGLKLLLIGYLLICTGVSGIAQTGELLVNYQKVPLFKGLDYNPAIQLRVWINSNDSVNYTGLKLKLDEAAFSSLESIAVHVQEGKKPWMDQNAMMVTHITPGKGIQEIPLSFTCAPGLSYIWITAKLKETDQLDGLVNLELVGLMQKQLVVTPVNADAAQKSGSTAFRKGVILKKAGEEGVHTFRIPGLTTTDKGTLIAVYDLRYDNTRDLPGNIDVGMSRSTDGGRTWEQHKVIIDMGEPHKNNGVGDPAVLFDPIAKKLWVTALWSKGNRSIAGSLPGLSPDSTGQFIMVSSADDGLSWSKPVNITAQVKDPKWHLYFNGPGKGIAMQDGTLVFASQFWDRSSIDGAPHSSIIYSSDHGKSWSSGTGAWPNTTEAQVVETKPGILMLNMRDNRGKFRTIRTTSDLGKSWSSHVTTYSALPDPVCMASLIKANVKVKGRSKEVLFFSNVNSSISRNDMTVKASLDFGETWQDSNQLLIDERKLYGYSCLTKLDEETIGLLYEGTRDLYFVRIPVSDILKNQK